MTTWPSDFIDRGCFSVPHGIFSPDSPLDRQERLLFTTLLALADRFLAPGRQGAFYATNIMLRECSGLSLRQMPVIRERLRRKKLLAFQRGHTRRATEYRILLDPFYRHYNAPNMQNLHTIRK